MTSPADLRTGDFDYHLPPERIAQTPVEPRDSSRLLVIHRDTGALEHRTFRDIGEYLAPGDLLVANDSRVIPGRLWTRKPTGGRVELLLLRHVEGGWWETLARPAARLRQGTTLEVVSGQDGEASPDAAFSAEVGGRTEAGGVLVRFDAPVEVVLARYGHVPLPPYIHERLADPERYQTVYARVAGSAAAPTAGLHFTPQLLESLEQRGVRFAFVTLHVGLDTFRPVQAERIVDHEMHSELVVVPDETARAVAETRAAGRRVVAVGTTAVRSLESWAAQTWTEGAGAPAGGVKGTGGDAGGSPWPARAVGAAPGSSEAQAAPRGWSGWTRLFIYPGYTFRAVDAMVTNFHLPRSSLMMLVSAFAGRDLIRRAYAEAIAQEYRFFSFGDATLML